MAEAMPYPNPKIQNSKAEKPKPISANRIAAVGTLGDSLATRSKKFLQ
jgi:hypothetical protein